MNIVYRTQPSDTQKAQQWLVSLIYLIGNSFYCLYSKHVTFLKNQFYNTRKNISFQDCIKYKSTFTMLKLFVNLNFNNWQQIPLK